MECPWSLNFKLSHRDPGQTVIMLTVMGSVGRGAGLEETVGSCFECVRFERPVRGK